MSNYRILSLDASGTPSYRHPSMEFGLTGAVISQKIKNRLDLKIRKIKKKFFRNEEVVLHYVEIVRKIGPFSVLKDKTTEIEFWAEILSILNNPNITYFFTVVNKQEAKKWGWQEQTIAERSYAAVIKMFIRKLKQDKQKGRILTESDIFQDEFLIKAHTKCQSQGFSPLKVSGKKYSEMITSVCLVNKNNLDPEVQLVDLLGTTARLRYRIKYLKSDEDVSGVEEKKLKLIERKLKEKTAKYEVIL